MYGLLYSFCLGGDLTEGLFALQVWGAYIWRGFYMEGLIFRMLRYFTVLFWNVLIKKHPIIAALWNNSNKVGTIIVSLRNRTAGRRGRQNACVWQRWHCYYEFCHDLHLTLMFSGLYKKIRLMGSEIWRKIISNKIIVTLGTQSLPSSLLCHPVAWVH